MPAYSTVLTSFCLSVAAHPVGLSELRELDLGDNSLSGTLPTGLARTQLTRLVLARNQLNGEGRNRQPAQTCADAWTSSLCMHSVEAPAQQCP
jgi:hypothetical protein